MSDDSDIRILQNSLALEHAGIAAYRLAGKSGLLSADTLPAALLFMGHHEQHRDSLAELIRKAGVSPAEPQADGVYVEQLSLASLRSEQDVLALAVQLEHGAAHGYAEETKLLQDRALAQLFARIGCDEAVHWAALNMALKRPIPSGAYLFS